MFLVAIQHTEEGTGDLLVGFINATATTSECLTHDSMSAHEAEGHTACIHSVCVDQKFRHAALAPE